MSDILVTLRQELVKGKFVTWFWECPLCSMTNIVRHPNKQVTCCACKREYQIKDYKSENYCQDI